jgi:prolyl-tRNA synthetase
VSTLAGARASLPDRSVLLPAASALASLPASSPAAVAFAASSPLLAKGEASSASATKPGKTGKAAKANKAASTVIVGSAAASAAAAASFKPKSGQVPTPVYVSAAEKLFEDQEREARIEAGSSFDPGAGVSAQRGTTNVKIARMSRAFIPTLYEVPADAQLRSHQLLVRAGYIRQLASGHYTFLPLALRVLHKIEAVVRDEMQRVGGEELSFPQVMPRQLWETTGRWTSSGAEMLKLKDRFGADFCLGPTHEEPATQLVQQVVDSHRQLPVRLFQIGRKFRDEARPRGGLLRCREFVMKDMYSFDTDYQAAHETYKQMLGAYKRTFARLGIPAVQVEADSGNIGGSLSHEYHVMADAGEDTLYRCELCAYTANQEKTAFAVGPAFDHATHSALMRAGKLTAAMRCDPRAVGLAPAEAAAETVAATDAAAAAVRAKKEAAAAAAAAATPAAVRLGGAVVANAGASLAAVLPPIDGESAEGTPAVTAASPSAGADETAGKADQASKLRHWAKLLTKRLLSIGARTDVPYVVNVVRLSFHGDRAASAGGSEQFMPDGPCKNHALIYFRADRELNTCAIKSFFDASDAEILSGEGAAVVLMQFYKYKVAAHVAAKASGRLPRSHNNPLTRETSQFVNVDLKKMTDWEDEGDTVAMTNEFKRVAKVNLAKMDDGGLCVMTDSSLVSAGQDVDMLGVDGYNDEELAQLQTNRPIVSRANSDEMGASVREQERLFAYGQHSLPADAAAAAEAADAAMTPEERLAQGDFSRLNFDTDNEALEEDALRTARAGGPTGDGNYALMSLAPTQGDFVLPADGDRCIQHTCGGQGTLRPRRGIEVGHVFYLGTKYSEPLQARYTDTKNRDQTIEMGCYGIGVSRLLAAAVEAEGGADEHGLRWPEPIAPYTIYVTAIGKPGEVPALATAAATGTLTPYQQQVQRVAANKERASRRRIDAGQLSNIMRTSTRSARPGHYVPLFASALGSKSRQLTAPNAARIAAAETAAETAQRSLQDMYDEVWNWGDVDNPTHAEFLAAALSAYVPVLDGDVLLDDRNGLSPGVRMRDATLVGIPWVIVVGRDMQASGRVEVQHRATGVSQLMTIAEAVAFFNGHQPAHLRAGYDPEREDEIAQAEVEHYRLRSKGMPSPNGADPDADKIDDSILSAEIEFDYERDRIPVLVDPNQSSLDIMRDVAEFERDPADMGNLTMEEARRARAARTAERRPALKELVDKQMMAEYDAREGGLESVIDIAEEKRRVASLEGATPLQKIHAEEANQDFEAVADAVTPPNFVEVIMQLRGPGSKPLLSAEISDLADAGIIFEDKFGFVRVDTKKARTLMHIVRGDKYRGKSEHEIEEMLLEEKRAKKAKVAEQQEVWDREVKAQETVQRKMAANAKIPVRASGLYQVQMPSAEDLMAYHKRTNKSMEYFSQRNESERRGESAGRLTKSGGRTLGARTLSGLMRSAPGYKGK